VEVVFITTPVLPTYYKFIDREIERKNTLAINGLCNKYSCKYFNYFRDDRFTEKDFYDNDHLNFIGAEKFSGIINDEIISEIKR
jgi:hypothetical protein